MEQREFYTYNRHREVIKVLKPSYDSNEEDTNWWDAMCNYRGVYTTYEEARRACEPIRVDTGPGPNDFYYM